MAKKNEELSYEAARQELLDVVQQLESGGVGLAESMELWERGEKLANICQAWLDGAKSRIQEAQAKAEAAAAAEAEPEAAE